MAWQHDVIDEHRYLFTDTDPEECHCRGNGWWLTPFDTWERCGVHYNGQEYPEWADDGPYDYWDGETADWVEMNYFDDDDELPF